MGGLQGPLATSELAWGEKLGGTGEVSMDLQNNSLAVVDHQTSMSGERKSFSTGASKTITESNISLVFQEARDN